MNLILTEWTELIRIGQVNQRDEPYADRMDWTDMDWTDKPHRLTLYRLNGLNWYGLGREDEPYTDWMYWTHMDWTDKPERWILCWLNGLNRYWLDRKTREINKTVSRLDRYDKHIVLVILKREYIKRIENGTVWKRTGRKTIQIDWTESLDILY